MPYAIVGIARNRRELQDAVDGIVGRNLAQMASGDIPPIYESGVVYERETRSAPPVGVERFQTARDCYLLGHADCDGLAPWRAAEAIRDGERARAEVIESPSGYHVRVRHEDGSVEDPSALLGMLDGYGLVGDDARPSARARRRRMLASLVRKGERLLNTAANTSGAPQRAALEQARAVSRMIRGHEAQMAADGEPPLTEAEINPPRARSNADDADGSVGLEWPREWGNIFEGTGIWAPWVVPALLVGVAWRYLR